MLPARISPIIIAASQAGAGTRVNSTTATMTQTGTITARWRRIVLSRQPASVSSCLTQSRLSSGSRNPSANSSQRSGPGSPGILVIVLSSRIAGPPGTRSARTGGAARTGRGPGARRARHPQAEPGGDGHLEALAADLDHDPLPPGH